MFEQQLYKAGENSLWSSDLDYHQLEQNQFYSRASHAPNHGAFDEDDGWIISFTHYEDANCRIPGPVSRTNSGSRAAHTQNEEQVIVHTCGFS